MNLVRSAKLQRRELKRLLALTYARIATWTAESYPDFMCIGAPRAATTWLHEKLRADTRIFLPRVKELDFFTERNEALFGTPRGLRWHRPFYFDMSNPIHWRWYWMQFQDAGVKKKGEISPMYSIISSERIRLIRDRMPDLKVIYILRNPVERAWSGLRKTVWYQQGAQRLAMKDEAWLADTIMHPMLLELGNYRDVLKRWDSVFPEENILVLFHDDFRADPGGELAKVYAFLEMDPPAQVLSMRQSASRTNAAPKLAMPPDIRTKLERHYAEQIRYLENRFERDLSHWTS